MANQGIMVPPNNAPWPGMQTPAPSHAHAAHSSHSPPPPGPAHNYPHTPSHPPSSPYPHYYPPHGHPPSSHQQPYYPYHHPYSAAPFPPHYPPYHHAPHYPSSGHMQPPAAQDTVSSTSPSPAPSSTTTFALDQTPASAASGSLSKSAKSIKAKPSSSKDSSSTPSDSKPNSKGSASTAPKTFRFEGSISSETYKTTKSFDLAGVNILNRKPLDTRTALDKLQRRRETHNRVERKRRDCINQLIDDLTRLLPPKHLEEVTSKCHRVNVLRGAVAHIQFLADTNTALTKSLDAAKEQGFTVPEVVPEENSSAAKSSSAVAPSGSALEDAMSMDVDTADSVKLEDMEDDLDDDQLTRAEKTSSRSSSASRLSSISRSASPRLTPSKIMANPPVIITNSPSPSSEKPEKTPSTPSKAALIPPPISVITAPSEADSHRQLPVSGECASPASSFSTSPMFPPASYTSPPGPSVSAFPPSPVSPSPSARQNPFALSASQSEGNSKDKQQLSPFMQHRLSTSPSLPPISSLASLQLQSPSGSSGQSKRMERLPGSQQTSPSMRPNSNTSAPTSPEGKFASHRSGPTLPPLKIPDQHLHPSYGQGGNNGGNSGGNNSSNAAEANKSSHRGSQSLSPHPSSTHSRHRDEQPPVSPFMLSPMPSRSPSGAPAPGNSGPTNGVQPYPPHWGHENSDAPPPPHPGQYMPGTLQPHGYPHGYPYPYPYHPSYGYPHPHGPPPPHHPHHQHGHPPPPPSAAQQVTSPKPTAARPAQPEPIFIQEEPWIVQRKRSTSTATGKGQAGAKPQQSNKKIQEKEEDQLKEDTPLSPSLSIASSASTSTNPNHRKRPSQKGSLYDGDDGATSKSISNSSKRVKQHESERELGNGADSEMSHDGRRSSSKQTEEDADVAQALTSLAQNA